MIVYGWNSKLIKHAPLENIECENCHQKTTLIGIHSNYVHIFWIPVFPYSKKATMVCGSCSHVTAEKQMSPDFKAKIKALKSTVPLPKYHFSGLGIIFAITVYFTFLSYKDDRSQSEYLKAPLVGDVYVLKNNDEPTKYKYSLLKVQGLEEDSVLISPNSYSYTKIPAKLDTDDGFYNYTIKIAKDKVAELHENGELKKVIRDYSSGFSRVLEYTADQEVTEESDLAYE